MKKSLLFSLLTLILCTSAIEMEFAMPDPSVGLELMRQEMERRQQEMENGYDFSSKNDSSSGSETQNSGSAN
jgi:hypothetical protein